MDPTIAVLYVLFLKYKLTAEKIWDMQITGRNKLELIILTTARNVCPKMNISDRLQLPTKIAMFVMCWVHKNEPIENLINKFIIMPTTKVLKKIRGN
jgi:hypothetical protein